MFVHVVGNAIDAEDNTGVEELRSDITTADSNARFERANPLTGEGVTPLFDGIVHKLVKPDEKVTHPTGHSRSTHIFFGQHDHVWLCLLTHDQAQQVAFVNRTSNKKILDLY